MGQRLPELRVRYAEYRGRCRHSHRQNRDHRQSEGRLTPEATQPVACITQEAIDRGDHPHVTRASRARVAFPIARRLVLTASGRHPACLQIALDHRAVRLDLLAQVSSALRARTQ